MNLDVFAVGLGIIAIIVAFYATMRRNDVTVPLIEGIASELTDFQTALGEAKGLVLAAEQLWKTGRLTKDTRFTWVYERLQSAFPDLAEDTLIASVESAVAWIKLVGDKG